MNMRLVSWTLPNEGAVGVSDLDTMGVPPNEKRSMETFIEYAARVCYRSTDKMGASPNCLQKKIIRTGHFDVIEHVSITFAMQALDDSALYFKSQNQHLQVAKTTGEGEKEWMLTGNARVWLDLVKKNDYLKVVCLPALFSLLPNVFAEFGGMVAGIVMSDSIKDTVPVKPYQENGVTVALLAYTPETPYWNPDNAYGGSNDHYNLTFLLEGVSRACTHQLVRHRLASFSQESQRYVDMSKGEWKPVMPPSIAEDEEAMSIMNEVWESVERGYQELRDLGIKKEDARFLLPNATESRLVITMSLSAWAHFFWLRAVDRAAQWEIRHVARVMFEMAHMIYPHRQTVLNVAYNIEYNIVYNNERLLVCSE